MNKELYQRCLAKITSITEEELDNSLRAAGFEFDIKEEANFPCCNDQKEIELAIKTLKTPVDDDTKSFFSSIKNKAQKLDTKATIVKALKQAYNFGQVYWAQADSDYSSQWKKADATEAKFDALVKEIEQLLEEKL